MSNEIKTLIGKGNTKEALEKANEIFKEDTRKSKMLVLLKGRFNNFKKKLINSSTMD